MHAWMLQGPKGLHIPSRNGSENFYPKRYYVMLGVVLILFVILEVEFTSSGPNGELKVDSPHPLS